jgi:hypothetical protein
MNIYHFVRGLRPSDTQTDNTHKKQSDEDCPFPTRPRASFRLDSIREVWQRSWPVVLCL